MHHIVIFVECIEWLPQPLWRVMFGVDSLLVEGVTFMAQHLTIQLLFKVRPFLQFDTRNWNVGGWEGYWLQWIVRRETNFPQLDEQCNASSRSLMSRLHHGPYDELKDIIITKICAVSVALSKSFSQWLLWFMIEDQGNYSVVYWPILNQNFKEQLNEHALPNCLNLCL